MPIKPPVSKAAWLTLPRPEVKSHLSQAAAGFRAGQNDTPFVCCPCLVIQTPPAHILQATARSKKSGKGHLKILGLMLSSRTSARASGPKGAGSSARLTTAAAGEKILPIVYAVRVTSAGSAKPRLEHMPKMRDQHVGG